jgi:hypothetical protein
MRSTRYTLSPTRINNAKAKDKLYRLSDGGGLFIEVSPTGQKTWHCCARHASAAQFHDIPTEPMLAQQRRRRAARPMRAEVGNTEVDALEEVI